MEIALLIWFANVSSGISHFLGFVGFIVIVVGVIASAFSYFISDSERNKPNVFIIRKWKFVLLAFFGLSSCFVSTIIPDEKTIYLMAGGYMAQKVVTSAKFNESANDVYEIVNLKLKDIKREMQDDVATKEVVKK